MTTSVVETRDAWGGKKPTLPLFPVLRSSMAEELGVVPVVLIPTFCAPALVKTQINIDKQKAL